LPGDDEPGVRDPPLSALGGVAVGRERERKVRLREPSEVEERRRRRRSRERVITAPPPPSLSRERGRPGSMYAPPPLGTYGSQAAGYGYVTPGFLG